MKFASFLQHYGVGHLDGGHSGRYPWGSGENPEQRSTNFLKYVEDQRKEGLTDAEIAEGMGLKNLSEFRKYKTISLMISRKAKVERAQALKAKGLSNSEIGREMGINESSVRSLLNQNIDENSEKTRNVAKALADSVKLQGMPIDVGKGAELYLGSNITRNRFDTSLELLKAEGYKVIPFDVPQVNSPGHKTHMMILTPPGMTWKEAKDAVYSGQIAMADSSFHTDDGGKTFYGLEYPSSISSDRVFIRYGDQGGKERDGLIELRPGVDDLSLGNSKYAQVRIAVDGTHFMKGMAVVSDNIPRGYDVIYNTNKETGTPKEKVFKPLKDDPDNPFGATIKPNGQAYYEDKDGNKRLSAINKLKEEGDWETYSKNLSSQFLSKQSYSLAKQQLDLDFNIRKAQYDEIMSYTNPNVKKKLLQAFADECEGASVSLKAAALPRQSSYVILPIDSLKDNEVYAPRYRQGETVVLIRHPHGGIFEIPQLKVNNKNIEAKKTIGGASSDAIGINIRVAQKLSGADFDGDTVIVIPNNDKKIRVAETLKELQNFDPSSAYPGYPGMKVMSEPDKQRQMGIVSNLITDMNIKGAPLDEQARAIKHSMVVIDAVKHELDYKRSYEENGIAELKRKWQTDPNTGKSGGASTLISRASSDLRVPEERQLGYDPETGEKIFTPTYREYTDRNGKKVQALTKTTKMQQVKDAYELTSNYPGTTTNMEAVYADYANKLKALAAESRKNYMLTKARPYSPSAAVAYRDEVASLKQKLDLAQSNAPRERLAQVYANAVYRAKVSENPNLTKDDKKKIKNMSLATGRVRYGAKKKQIELTDKEWNAIQSGALSSSLVDSILDNSNLDIVKQLALPKSVSSGVSDAKRNRMLAMLNNGYTIADVADQFDVSASTISKIKAESR